MYDDIRTILFFTHVRICSVVHTILPLIEIFFFPLSITGGYYSAYSTILTKARRPPNHRR